MVSNTLSSFTAKLDIIGINPFVFVPQDILQKVFLCAGKNKGTIRVRGFINETPFEQTLVRYSGDWRLYINTLMLKNSPKRIGELLKIKIAFNPTEKKNMVHAGFAEALKKNKKASETFNKLPLSRQNEIVRYIANLKSTNAVMKNIKKAIDFLLGKGSFVGRNSP